jgi:hypothetical protein
MTVKGVNFGSRVNSGGVGTALSFTEAEQSFLERTAPSHWLDAGARSTIDSRMALIDRVKGTIYRQTHTSDPSVTTGIGGAPTLVFTANSIFTPEEGQAPINLTAWSMLFVCSNLGAGVTSRILIGPKVEADHTAGVGAPYAGLGSGVRFRIYDASAAGRLDASGTYDFAGSEKCVIASFDTTNGLALEVDGNAAGTNASRLFTLPFYGEWGMTAIYPYNILHANYATEKAAAEAYVASKYGITFA